MKKLFIIINIFISIVFISGCFGYESDDEIISKNISSLLTALEDEKHQGIKNLFAKKIIVEDENFDEQLNNLILYYKGKNTSFTIQGKMVERDKHEDLERKWFKISVNVVTTEDVFDFAIIWYVKDTKNDNNVGIWSLYIINSNENPFPNKPYPGDGLWNNGIYIGLYKKDA